MTTPGETPADLDAMMVPDDMTEAQSDAARWRYGFYVVLTGLVVILVGFAVAVLRTGEAGTLFAGMAGVVGTIIGAYFGVQAGQSGKDRAEAELRRANDRATRMAAYVGPQNIDHIMGPVRRPGRG
ncbi:hypothetical protein GCM10009555_035880 [Acrocarpospora macrocephala]|uniref:Uncharacterized protein n=2 Tax=Acrocarpospora TaxID=90974 RepID=A0A5M3XZL8_9ACTN|nr:MULTISPECIES: hypothetical protein [Acrocarpospora]GES13776.1 hypothetical protein Amac_073730 [Acrocarpospora macrocephala]GES26376.1 hypothetical protein Aple_092750 [Acrocarpospora pleiomorpha]